MDKEYLNQMLKDLTVTELSIKGTSNYCSLNCTSSEEIAKMLEEYILNSRKDRKILYIFLIHEIFLETMAKNSNVFIVSIGNRLKNIITNFSLNCEKFEDIKKARAIVDKWQKDQLFHQNFLYKLQQIMVQIYSQYKIKLPKYKELYEQQVKYDNKKDVKYDKTFIHNYKLIQENELTKQIYKHIIELDQNWKKIYKINMETDQEQLSSLPPDSLSEKIDEYKICKEDLIKNIEQTQNLYKEVASKCEYELFEYSKNVQEK